MYRSAVESGACPLAGACRSHAGASGRGGGRVARARRRGAACGRCERPPTTAARSASRNSLIIKPAGKWTDFAAE